MTSVPVDAMPPRLQRAIRTPEGETFLRGIAGTRVRQNGCAAAAYAALYANVDVITAYPIRPYTAIMMNLAQFVADGILDAEYIHADGEHSQFSAAFGAGSCGARAYTGSSGVGVTYGYEMYSIISGARIPIQMAIADRTLDPPGDFGSEHTDALCTRDMGWLMAGPRPRRRSSTSRCSPTRSARTRGCCCPRWWCRTAISCRTSRAR